MNPLQFTCIHHSPFREGTVIVAENDRLFSRHLLRDPSQFLNLIDKTMLFIWDEEETLNGSE
jgi:hypothetical protein